MCKHQHTTVVYDTLDDGSPVAIHQCDMCGMTVPTHPTDVPGDELGTLPNIDMTALEKEMTRRWREVLSLPRDLDKMILRKQEPKAEEDGDILWA